MGGLGVVVDVVFPAPLRPADRPARGERSLLVRGGEGRHLVVTVQGRHPGTSTQLRPGRGLAHLLEDLQLGHVVVILGSVPTLILPPRGGRPGEQ